MFPTRRDTSRRRSGHDGGGGGGLSSFSAPIVPPTPSFVGPSLPLSILPLSTTTSDTAEPTFTIPGSSGTSSTGSGSLTIAPTNPVPAPAPTQSPGNPPSAPWSFITQGATPNATTCQPYQIQWSVSNANPSTTHLDLYITNDSGTANMTIATDQPLTNDAYMWAAVSVNPGMYQIQGIGSDRSQSSYALFVQAGSDTSCLASTGSGNTTSPVAGPSPIVAASHGANTAAIAGGTVGGIVLLAFVGIVIILLRRICTQRRRALRSHGVGLRPDWNGLNSVDSRVPVSRTESVHGDMGAGMVMADAAVQQGSTPLHATSRALDSSSSLEGEKGGVIGSGSKDLTTTPGNLLPILARHAAWSSDSVIHHGVSNVAGVGAGGPHANVLPRPVELAHLANRTTTTTLQQSSPRPSFDLASDPDPFSSTPIAGANNNRRSSRTPRKPVPTYDPIHLELEMERDAALVRTGSDESGYSQFNVPTHQTPMPTPTQTQMPMPMPMPAMQPSSYGSSSSTFAPSSYGSYASQGLGSQQQHSEALLHGLKSKSSGHFDGQPVHYLIPDMPPAPME